MSNHKYSIDKYDYSIELQPTDEGLRSKTFANITLFSEGKNVADLNFLNPGEKTERKYFSGHQLNIDLSHEKLGAVLDLLRSKDKVRLLIWHSGTEEHPTHLEARLDIDN